MFSNEDAKEAFQAFPSQTSNSKQLSSLVLTSDGSALVTLSRLEKEFNARVTRQTERLKISSLASDLSVNQDVALKLVHAHPLVLFNTDGSATIPLQERKTLQNTLADLLKSSVVTKSDFAAQNGIGLQSLDSLLQDFAGDLLNLDEHVCSRSYEESISKSILESLNKALTNTKRVDIGSRDLLGSPPTWLVLDTLKKVLDSQNLAEKFDIQENVDTIRCTPKQLTDNERGTIIKDLRDGAVAYLNLHALVEKSPHLFATVEDARNFIASESSSVEFMDSIAVSNNRVSKLAQESLQILQTNGCVHLNHVLQHFPNTLHDRIAQQVEQIIQDNQKQNLPTQKFKLGDFITTQEQFDKAQTALLDLAKIDAAAQFLQLRDSPGKEVKFSLSDITARISDGDPFQLDLVKEKATERLLDEQFWVTVSEHEAQNESDFSVFWVERVVSRLHIYTKGLIAVTEPKLREQLEELFVSYVRKELFPDAISKSRSQNLVLSRKTRKNISKLESVLVASRFDLQVAHTSLNRFNRKQGIEDLDRPKLDEAKKAMMGDMTRRMQKQKQSDGPVLFLTLILIQSAKNFEGVVYATGKFAPKLLKQLKPVIEPEQYDQLEKWKEAAKAGTLSAEDRQGMKEMADA
ncbi:hypothetical protein IQ07DRAFT_627009 [Pyrenochaeta sp. DS3sAY3a]|nr:hypothetical protein IQ07DRAFT_627009 [Pyrenochaeta sp. DS3sAY3a]